MKVFAAVFAEELDGSKSRLSTGFAAEERRLLSAAMLEDVLTAVKFSVVREVVVVGTDSCFRKVADKFAVSFISLEGSGFVSAVRKVITWCLEKKAAAVLVLPAKVPLVSSNDINRIVELGSEAPSVVLSPSMMGGTNAVFLNPPNLIKTQFGPNSFFELVKEVIDKGVVLRFYSSREITLDVDSEEDLCKLFEVKNNTVSKRVFERIRLQRNKKR
jgi:2-phospho-L-lactate guanylyltransferase